MADPRPIVKKFPYSATSVSGLTAHFVSDGINSVRDYIAPQSSLTASDVTYGSIPGTGIPAIKFAGTNNGYVLAKNTDKLQLVKTAGTSFTVEAWVYATGVGQNPSGYGGMIVNKDQEFEFCRMGDGRIAVAVDWGVGTDTTLPGGGWIIPPSGTAVVPLNSPTHVAVVLDNTTLRIVLNGTLAWEKTGLSRFSRKDPADFYIGNRSGKYQTFDGYIGDVRIWNYARSVSDINANINSEFENVNGRYTSIMPFSGKCTVYAWGAGGGAGGADAGTVGGAGSAGLHNSTSFTFVKNDLIEVAIGEGGTGGVSHSGSSPGGKGGASRINLGNVGTGSFNGGDGSSSGPGGGSGAGGGGGGATVVLKNNNIVLVAGGGGAGGGAGNDGNGAGPFARKTATPTNNASKAMREVQRGVYGFDTGFQSVNPDWRSALSGVPQQSEYVKPPFNCWFPVGYPANGKILYEFYLNFDKVGTYSFFGCVNDYGAIVVDDIQVVYCNTTARTHTGTFNISTTGYHKVGIRYDGNTAGSDSYNTFGYLIKYPDGTNFWQTLTPGSTPVAGAQTNIYKRIPTPDSINVQSSHYDAPGGHDNKTTWIDINGKHILYGLGRGHTLAVFNPNTLALESKHTSGGYQTSGSTELRDALAAVTDGKIIVIASFDVCTLDQATRNLLNSQFGGTRTETWGQLPRTAHFFIGIKNGGVTAIESVSANKTIDGILNGTIYLSKTTSGAPTTEDYRGQNGQPKGGDGGGAGGGGGGYGGGIGGAVYPGDATAYAGQTGGNFPMGDSFFQSGSLVARSDGRWGSFQNTYAVWPTGGTESGWFTIYRTFNAPYSGTYYFRSTVDNGATVYVDDVALGGTANFNQAPSPVAKTLVRGTHQLRFEVYNGGDVAGFAMTISDSVDSIIWDTRTYRDVVSPAKDNRYYIDGIAGGGIPNGGNGQNGYAVLVFEPESPASAASAVKVGSSWRQVTAGYVKVDGEWKTIDTAYVKKNGVWHAVVSTGDVTGVNFTPNGNNYGKVIKSYS
ncbi:Interleukin-like EMT inducer [uncultured Caudovirales phage]|uniref:Interleukin-like EMT inducer n=1 Tax=uncultured Caudovirales phage TaxID=2100421 RepID=A0A6J5LJF8_9CAUD|nr:Interleukin-like EMT inducer [uncultured Caudovirales phage]